MSTKKTPATGDLKKQMADNAAIIQEGGKKNSKAKDGEFEIVPKKPEVIKPSERAINEIIHDRFIFRDDGSGVDISADLDAEECARSIKYFSSAREVSQFIIGELILFAEKNLPDKYEAIMVATGLRRQSLANIASVTTHVAPEMRRMENLTFTHHVAVAKLTPAKQKQLLNKAEKEDLSVAELKREVAEIDPPKTRKFKASGDKTDQLADTGSRDDFEMSQKQIEKDEKMLEKADTVLLYVKGKAFADLNANARDDWKLLLMQFSDAYEGMLK